MAFAILELSGGSYADPRTINARGQNVGLTSLAGDQQFHAFLWQTGTMEDLGTLGGSFSVAGWINNRGQVIGASTTADDTALRGFLWDRGEMISIEPVPGDTCSDAFEVNGRG